MLLLRILGVSKQALNGPLRTLKELALIDASPDVSDKRIKRLTLSSSGCELENRLSQSQRELDDCCFLRSGGDAELHWRAVMDNWHKRSLPHYCSKTDSPISASD